MVIRHDHLADGDIVCGVEARKHFPFDNDYLNLNHGSFGAIPSSIRTVQRAYQDASEAQPDVFIRYTYPPLLSRSRQVIADYLHCPKSSLVLVPNATTALNTILRNLIYQPNDVAIYFSTIYSSIQKTLLYLSETTPLLTHGIPLTYPVSPSSILTLFNETTISLRTKGLNPRLVIIDTVSSVPGVLFPFEALTTACRAQDILSVIDGAHGAGHIPLDLSALNPDFFVTNLHKWLFVPRPCAVLYVPEQHQAAMRSSLPTSHGFVPRGVTGVNNPLPEVEGEELSVFEETFQFTGTGDFSAFLCVEAALRWRERVVWRGQRGEDAVRGYCCWLAGEAGRIVSARLGTETMERERQEGCAFSNVRLPLEYADLKGGEVDFEIVLKIARWMEKVLVDEYRTFVAIFWHAEGFWVRLSAQIYLTLEDWETAAGWLEDVCERARRKRW
ncbi:hypothetical protein CAC42_4963 [Sphaceloma murrayae]|uniref:Aminotransferase class V domain-containing protein n=1 Tax=Sphaceloma murrayae TaxID=2082308 RepID=A0A2K1QPW5_9PEZI|nr:hypothetical protein CAC42_4963 [Sphaceloma murrayae]